MARFKVIGVTIESDTAFSNYEMIARADMKTIIKEIVKNGGWVGNNKMAFKAITIERIEDEQ